MEHALTIAALTRLHAELGGRIKQAQAEQARLRGDMKHVEAVIKLLQPGYDTRSIAVRRRNRTNPWYRRGEVVRAAFDVLRAAERPLTSREITERMLKGKGIADPNQKQLRDLIGGVQ